MKNIWHIFQTDIKNIIKRPAAIIVIVALMILPSMYAWFNILPSWDPYSNTENVAVAVVNLDEGDEIEGEFVNVGDEVVESLEENKQLGWQFVDEATAEKGVEQGDYYASIIIPKDFTNKLTSVLEDEPEKPILDYYINEKINAIAPKVTNAGATGIVESVHQGFVKVANEAIFSAFNEAGIELAENQENIERLRDAIYEVEKDLPKIEKLLSDAEKDLEKVEKASKKAHKGVSKAEEVTGEVEALSKKISGILDEVDGYVQEYIPVVKKDMNKAKQVAQALPKVTDGVTDKVKDFDDVIEKIETNTDKIDDGVAALETLEGLLKDADKAADESDQLTTLISQLKDDQAQLDKTKNEIEAAIKAIEKTNNAKEKKAAEEQSFIALKDDIDIPDSTVTVEQLEAMLAVIDKRQEALNTLISATENVEQSIADGIFQEGATKVNGYQKDLKAFKKDIQDKIKEAEAGKAQFADVLDYIDKEAKRLETTVNDLVLFIDDKLLPTYEKEMGVAKQAIKSADENIAKVNSYFPRAKEVLEKIDDAVVKGKKELKEVNAIYPDVKERVIKLAKKTRELDEKGDLSELIRFLKNDPTAEGEFFSDPIILQEHEIFPVPNYGSAMAPFFTALALWVGGLILVSTLVVDVPNKKQYKSYEAYFGRFLTFWIIGLIQALVVTSGNMFLLKTYVAHKFMFVIFGFIISTVFIVIIYTFVSVFGNTGKVIAIILLVMQLGASGGTFPIQTTPEFFQKIHLFMPFTHGLGLFREAVGGIIWPVVWKHIAWLAGYVVIFLFIGIKLKEKINKRSDKFLEEARDSKIIL